MLQIHPKCNEYGTLKMDTASVLSQRSSLAMPTIRKFAEPEGFNTVRQRLTSNQIK